MSLFGQYNNYLGPGNLPSDHLNSFQYYQSYYERTMLEAQRQLAASVSARCIPNSQTEEPAKKEEPASHKLLLLEEEI